MTIIWELDFYSRPVLDENQKKIWEVLICNCPDRQGSSQSFSQPFRWVQECDAQAVNSGWLAEELKKAIAHNTQLGNQTPQKVRFYRPSMTNIITRGCKQAELIPQISRRLFTLTQWLDERMKNIYPQREGFIAFDLEPLPLKATNINPLPAPDALMGESWLVASLKAKDFAEVGDWSMDFGEFFDLTDLDPETVISGLIMISSRALPLAAWMSGVDPISLKFNFEANTVDVNSSKISLILEAGEADRWILTSFNTTLKTGTRNIQAIAQAQSFEQAKQHNQGVHFIAVQISPEVEHFAGFWLLKDLA